MPLDWRPHVDPECPEVQAHHEQPATDPLLLLAELTESASDWEAQHKLSCTRCQTYSETPTTS